MTDRLRKREFMKIMNPREEKEQEEGRTREKRTCEEREREEARERQEGRESSQDVVCVLEMLAQAG